MAVEIYNEPDRPYVARQFNGPIISAFIKAVYNYFHRPLDHHAEYFKNLSIETADIQHLYFIGRLMGLQLFSLFTDPSGNVYLVYTDEDYPVEEYEYDNGWASDYRAHQPGDGVFGTGDEQGYPVTLTVEQYRKILKAISSVPSAAADSIHIIDVLLAVFLDVSPDDPTPKYNISYNNGGVYKDVVNVVLGPDVSVRYTIILQSMFDRLLSGASVTILVSHI
jgi:hypothetical protein